MPSTPIRSENPGLFGFIDKSNIDVIKLMLQNLGITYTLDPYGDGFKFKNQLKPEVYKDIIAHLKPEKISPQFLFWPFLDTALQNQIQQTSQIKSYFDYITTSEVNKQILIEYILQNRIATYTPQGYKAIMIVGIKYNLINHEYVRYACEGIMRSPKGNYKAALADAADKMSGKITQIDDTDDDEEIDNTTDENAKSELIKKKNQASQDQTVLALRGAFKSQIDLNKEKYPAPMITVPGMNMKALTPRTPGLWNTARQIINPAGAR